MARVFHRKIGRIAVTENGVFSLRIPRNHLFKNLLLEFNGAITIAGGTTNGTVWGEQPFSLIRRVRVIRNGSEILQNLDGGALSRISRVNHFTTVPVTSIANGAIVSSATIKFALPVDFAVLGLSNPGISLLRAVGTSSLELEITMGNANQHIVFGGDRAESIDAGAYIDVYSREILDVSGIFSDKQFAVHRTEVTADNPELTIDLPLGPLYRRIFVRATAQGGGLLSDVIVNNVSLKSDALFAHYDKVGWYTLQAQNKIDYHLEAAMAGWGVIDLAQDGNPAGMIETNGASQFSVILDVTFASGVGTNYVEVIPETVLAAAVEDQAA